MKKMYFLGVILNVMDIKSMVPLVQFLAQWKHKARKSRGTTGIYLL